MSLLRIKKPLAEGAGPVKGKLPPRLMVLFWLPLIFTGIGAVVGWEFVYFAFASALALNGKIMLVMLWGSFAMFGHMRTAYKEDRAFHAGIDWLRKGAFSSEPNPKLGPPAFVQGMLERLEKLGLGHQVYVQSAAMEPELEALEQYFHKRQALSNFLVGLMVGLGLLGTFIGLLQTLIATSELIGGIASALSGGGNMEQEFAKIVGGLQKPLASMGTAFSASMFGLVGSIMLGFQGVVVNKTVAELVDSIREEVLSLAEKSKDGAHVEITERYLATLMADMMETHRQSEARLSEVVRQIGELTPAVTQAALSSQALARTQTDQAAALERTAQAVEQVRQVVPALGELAQVGTESLRESVSIRVGVQQMCSHLPDQAEMSRQLREALMEMSALRAQVDAAKRESTGLTAEVREQSEVLKRIDAMIYQAQKDELRHALEGQRG
jgi:hypothetical protein